MKLTFPLTNLPRILTTALRSIFISRQRGILFGVICVITLFSALQIFSTLTLANILQDARQNVIATESLRQQQAVMDKARMELLMASDKLNRAGIYFMQDKETGSDGSWHSLMEASQASLVASDKYFRQFAALTGGLQGDAQKAAAELQVSYQMFYDGLREQSEGLQKTNTIDAFFNVPIQAFQDDFSDKYYRYLSVNEQTAVSLSDRLLGTLSQAKILFFGALGLLALIAFAVWHGITRWVIRPLQQVIAHIGVLAAGDLSGQIDGKTSRVSEVHQLNESLRGMQTGLRRLISEVRDASSQIMVNINQIAQGNEELSSQSLKQHDELNAANHHITSLTERVKDNAQNAHQASQRAEQAQKVATSGGDVMIKVDSAMKEIVSQSAEMSSIVAIIDNVAFQTNILALNAAIEAAHAGQYGRGFAVVAKEIGLLAQKSSHSTRGIHLLIEESVTQIGRGSTSVTLLSKSLNEIITLFSGLHTLVSEIAEASQDQRQSIDEVSERIVTLTQVTQQNSQLAQQAASSSQQLLSQSQRLEKAVSRFGLGEIPAAA
ncbi:methyl-accepting chemotaxis protein [Ewingella americana]|uniref:HAMP domain-containing protein n=1 Tax=Ewingella americana TaxID=41202 RepID=A0A502GT39_9GAMM|nr:methyl-accepting chemotaxis protein [Ewingella americana]TPG65044.1 HAMP domain-containing protein [Ewingella americana]